MPDCCHSECATGLQTKTHTCPVNGQEYKSVALKTILHHINSPWKWVGNQQGYYFCADPYCDVVYFGEDNSVISKELISTSELPTKD